MKMPNWLKEVLKAIAYALLAITGTIYATSCSSAHTVIQSSQQSQYVKGDTTVTELSIKYEQVGKIQK